MRNDWKAAIQVATISLGMIVKNEGRTLKACLDSVVPFVSQVVIGLGGESTDDTEQIIEDYELPVGSKVFMIEWEDDFSKARQQVLEKCTGEYFLWVDGDDVLVGGEKLQTYIQLNPNIDAFYMGYDYSRDENGLNNCYLIRERLLMRHPELPVDWKWTGPVHEVPIPQFEHLALKVDDIIVVHNKPPFKHEADRNLKILYRQLEEGEPNPDPRILVYLGNENLGRGEILQGILHLQRFVKLSGWAEEKYQAQVHISNAWLSIGNIDKALQAAQDAVAILPEWPDAYFAMAKAYSSEGSKNWTAALEYLKIGTQKPKPQTMLIINPMEYTYEPSLMIAICYTQLGDYEVALENYRQAYSIKQDPLVLQNMQLLSEQIELNKVQQSFLHLREFLGRHDEWLKVRKLFDVVPKAITSSSAIHEVWERSMDQTAHIQNPQIMTDFYNDNPHWQPMNEEMFLDQKWLSYPRMRFALDVARRINAKTIVDWGCSDGFIALPLAKELEAHVTGFDLDPRCTDLATVRAKRWGIDARFEVGNVDQIGGWEGRKADLAILFEILEHVVEPEQTLSRVELTADHIAITTPYLAWEGGNIPAWDKAEPKGHLRIFDQYDIERLLTGRGQIMNIYHEPWGPTGWIFADYKPGVKLGENIIIGAQMGLEEWGPRKLAREGLGGSETAVIKVAEALAKGNRRPIVYNPIDSPGYYNGVCYRPVDHFRPEIASDLYIAWRMPEAADAGINTRHLSLWFHDTDAGDRLTRERATRFDSFVVLSEWHRTHILKLYPFIPPEKVFVIGNGVDVSRFEEPARRDLKKVIYSSSPDRGLDIILEYIWPKVLEEVPDAELHTFYGWQNIDKAMTLPGTEYIAKFRAHMNQLLLTSKNVVQHGRVPQDQLAKEMQEGSIWLYPTYFSETYCITAIEAQLAGLFPITSHLAALNETVQSGVFIDGDVHDPEIQKAYVAAVVQYLNNPPDEEFRQKIKQAAPAISWDQVAANWEQFLHKGEDQWQTSSTMSGETPSLEVLSAG
jgi:glycosyltransferase involved in cell wall biosynthesis/tetratricopeptide (TPR) repeat protein